MKSNVERSNPRNRHARRKTAPKSIVFIYYFFTRNFHRFFSRCSICSNLLKKKNWSRHVSYANVRAGLGPVTRRLYPKKSRRKLNRSEQTYETNPWISQTDFRLVRATKCDHFDLCSRQDEWRCLQKTTRTKRVCLFSFPLNASKARGGANE